MERLEASTRGAAEELDSLMPALKLDRRGFVKTSLGVGFAAGVLPVSAQTMITTDAQGLTAGEVKIPTKDGEMPAYRAMPAGKTGLPTVLVVHEIWGVHEYLKDVSRRLAKLGYMAVAPELFARQGDASKISDTGAIIKDIVAKVSDAQVMGDLDAAAAWVEKNGGGGNLGITGFCWGGRSLDVRRNPDPLPASHGTARRAPIRATRRRSTWCEIRPNAGLYGGADGGIPNDTVEKLGAALKASGNSKSEIVIYPNTPHAFHADYRPSYRKEAAEDGWKKLTAWFKQHLG
jgi:carboxymethylenebutenolidase